MPPDLKVNAHFWGECISGAISEDEFLAEFEKAGFFGLTVLKRQFWKEVEGQNFYSVTVRGFKFQKGAGCVHQGHRANGHPLRSRERGVEAHPRAQREHSRARR